MQADASKLPDLDRLIEKIKAEKGRLDVVFANLYFGAVDALADGLRQAQRFFGTA